MTKHVIRAIMNTETREQPKTESPLNRSPSTIITHYRKEVKTMKLELTKQEAAKIRIACTVIANNFETDSNSQKFWRDLHDKINLQIAESDINELKEVQ